MFTPSFIFIFILSVLLALANSYQIIFVEKGRIASLHYVMHRSVLIANVLFTLMAIMTFPVVQTKALIVFADVFLDFGVLVGYFLFMFIAYQTFVNAQISLKMRTDDDELLTVKIVYAILLAAMFICLLCKLTLVATHDDTFYKYFYYIVASIIMFAIIVSCWWFLFRLKNGLKAAMGGISKYSSTTQTDNPIESFQLFLIISTVFAAAGIAVLIYYAYSFYNFPTTYFDRDNSTTIPYASFVAVILTLIATIYSWKFPEAEANIRSREKSHERSQSQERLIGNSVISRNGNSSPTSISIKRDMSKLQSPV